jgi:hypothetical protein
MGGFSIGWSRHHDEGCFRDFQAEAERLAESAKKFDIETKIYDNKFIENLPYYDEHKDILTKVSFGFAYKPICLFESLGNLNNGDILLWADSNHIIDKDPQIFIDLALEYGVFFRNHIWVVYPQKEWCKRDTFVNMDCDSERYWNFPQLQDNVLVFRIDEKSRKFITEWKNYCLDYKTMFGENKYPDFPGLKHHRHNQAIFTNLACKYEYSFLDRTNSPIDFEYIIPEMEYIQDKNPIDYSYRKEEDRKINA